jgi:hypothetical protein
MTNVTLTYQDVLELLLYEESTRRPLEILGYEYSSRGIREFRRERPDYLPQIHALIRQSVDEAGNFPRALNSSTLEDGTYLERRSDGNIRLHFSVETSINSTAQVYLDFTSMDEAIHTLLTRLLDPAYFDLSRQGAGTKFM